MGGCERALVGAPHPARITRRPPPQGRRLSRGVKSSVDGDGLRDCLKVNKRRRDGNSAVAEIAGRFQRDVLGGMKATFVGKEEVIDLLGSLPHRPRKPLPLGPPGSAKSALVTDLGSRLHGRVFEYLLTRFTEPNELFGPFDIRKLREGELITNTEGMLPEASIVFLDELLNANSAILNSCSACSTSESSAAAARRASCRC